LPNGEVVRARLDRSPHTESVWLGKRLVSRAFSGGKPGGHVVALGPARGGAYRGASEARVVFDVSGADIAACELSIDGAVIAPSRAPSPVRKVAGGSLAFGVAFAAVRVVTQVLIGHSAQPHAYVPRHDPPPRVQPASRPDPAPTEGERIVASVKPALKKCYERGLADNPKLTGWSDFEVEVSEIGEVLSIRAAVHGLPDAMERCAMDVLREAHYVGNGEKRRTGVMVVFGPGIY
jgi:hypothetical protein